MNIEIKSSVILILIAVGIFVSGLMMGIQFERYRYKKQFEFHAPGVKIEGWSNGLEPKPPRP